MRPCWAAPTLTSERGEILNALSQGKFIVEINNKYNDALEYILD